MPVVNLLPCIETYLEDLRMRVESGKIKPQTAAELLRQLRLWLRQQQQWGLLGNGSISHLRQQLTAEQRLQAEHGRYTQQANRVPCSCSSSSSITPSCKSC